MDNIPIYRAKKIDNEEYVEGFYCEDLHGNHAIAGFHTDACGAYHYRIDGSTLAIHFPSMKDSEDNPIFASLSESGKGGDILRFTDRYEWHRGSGCFIGLSNEEIHNKIATLPFEDRTVIHDIEGLNYSTSDVKEGRWQVIKP